MKSFLELQRETSAVQLDFLLADIATGNTFLDVARTTGNATTRARNLKNACEAHAVVLRMSKRVRITPEQSADLDRRLHLLQQRIDGMNLQQRFVSEAE